MNTFVGCILSKFYIKPQRLCVSSTTRRCCILSKFYIKPQRICLAIEGYSVVSYRNSTSNHNTAANKIIIRGVVSYRNSTSNHNSGNGYPVAGLVVSYRNSTSNHNTTDFTGSLPRLYLIEILHQTTTGDGDHLHAQQLYLIEILHQTTTAPRRKCRRVVVSYRNSTSNHNVGPHID